MENPYPETIKDEVLGVVPNDLHKAWAEGYEERCREMRDVAIRLEALAKEMDAELMDARIRKFELKQIKENDERKSES